MRAAEMFGLVVIGLSVGYFATRRQMHDAERAWQARTDSVTRVVEVRDAELAALGAEILRWGVIANRRDTVRLPARRLVKQSPDSLHVPPDLYRNLAIIDTLLREQSVLHDRIQRDAVRLGAYATLTAYQDSSISLLKQSNALLRGQLETAPVGRPACRVLGLIPCPTVVAGYGATLTGGAVQLAPAVVVGIPIL